MAKITNTNDLCTLLQKITPLFEEYAPGVATNLNQFISALNEIETIEIKELKNLPKLLKKAKEREEKAKEEIEISKKRLAEEKDKTKEKEEKLKNQFLEQKERLSEQLQIEKEKFNKKLQDESNKSDKLSNNLKELKQEILLLKSEQREELKNIKEQYKQELQAIKEGKKLEKKVKKQKNASKVLLSDEQLNTFHDRLREFQRESQEIAKEFENQGEDSLKKLENLATSLTAKYEESESKVAIELAHLVEHGGMQSMKDERIWRSHNLGYYNVSQEAKNVLSNATFNTAQLKTLFQLLQIGLPKSKNKKSLEDALIQELSMRANTR